MINDIIVIDDIVNQTYQNEIERSLLREMGAAWFLLDDVAYPSNAVKTTRPGIVHPLFEKNEGILSPLYNLMLPLIFESVTKINFKFEEIIRGRAFIQFPTKENYINHAHVDSNEQHLVCLYYVNDSNGETVIYNQTPADIPNLPGIDSELMTVKQTVVPKKGRMVLFNGMLYHSSSTPTINKRCVVNFNVKGYV